MHAHMLVCRCRYQVRSPGAIREVTAVDIARQFFTEQELLLLGSKLQLQGVDVATSKDQWYMVTYKTIAQARADAKRVRSEHESVFGGSQASSDAGGAPPSDGIQRDTEARRLNREWARERGEKEGGASNYYRNVKVCLAACGCIYVPVPVPVPVIVWLWLWL